MRSATFLGTNLVLATLLTLSLATPGLADGDTLRPGKWEVVTKGSVDQAGQKMEMPESRAEMCVQPMPAAVAEIPADNSCTMETLEKAEGRLVTRATCGEVVTDSTMTWNDASYESVSHMVMTSNGQTIMVSDTKSSGRYLGACG